MFRFIGRGIISSGKGLITAPARLVASLNVGGGGYKQGFGNGHNSHGNGNLFRFMSTGGSTGYNGDNEYGEYGVNGDREPSEFSQDEWDHDDDYTDDDLDAREAMGDESTDPSDPRKHMDESDEDSDDDSSDIEVEDVDTDEFLARKEKIELLKMLREEERKQSFPAWFGMKYSEFLDLAYKPTTEEMDPEEGWRLFDDRRGSIPPSAFPRLDKLKTELKAEQWVHLKGEMDIIEEFDESTQANKYYKGEYFGKCSWGTGEWEKTDNGYFWRTTESDLDHNDMLALAGDDGNQSIIAQLSRAHLAGELTVGMRFVLEDGSIATVLPQDDTEGPTHKYLPALSRDHASLMKARPFDPSQDKAIVHEPYTYWQHEFIPDAVYPAHKFVDTAHPDFDPLIDPYVMYLDANDNDMNMMHDEFDDWVQVTMNQDWVNQFLGVEYEEKMDEWLKFREDLYTQQMIRAHAALCWDIYPRTEEWEFHNHSIRSTLSEFSMPTEEYMPPPIPLGGRLPADTYIYPDNGDVQDTFGGLLTRNNGWHVGNEAGAKDVQEIFFEDIAAQRLLMSTKDVIMEDGTKIEGVPAYAQIITKAEKLASDAHNKLQWSYLANFFEQSQTEFYARNTDMYSVNAGESPNEMEDEFYPMFPRDEMLEQALDRYGEEELEIPLEDWTGIGFSPEFVEKEDYIKFHDEATKDEFRFDYNGGALNRAKYVNMHRVDPIDEEEICKEQELVADLLDEKFLRDLESTPELWGSKEAEDVKSRLHEAHSRLKANKVVDDETMTFANKAVVDLKELKKNAGMALYSKMHLSEIDLSGKSLYTVDLRGGKPKIVDKVNSPKLPNRLDQVGKDVQFLKSMGESRHSGPALVSSVAHTYSIVNRTNRTNSSSDPFLKEEEIKQVAANSDVPESFLKSLAPKLSSEHPLYRVPRHDEEWTGIVKRDPLEEFEKDFAGSQVMHVINDDGVYALTAEDCKKVVIDDELGFLDTEGNRITDWRTIARKVKDSRGRAVKVVKHDWDAELPGHNFTEEEMLERVREVEKNEKLGRANLGSRLSKSAAKQKEKYPAHSYLTKLGLIPQPDEEDEMPNFFQQYPGAMDRRGLTHTTDLDGDHVPTDLVYPVYTPGRRDAPYLPLVEKYAEMLKSTENEVHTNFNIAGYDSDSFEELTKDMERKEVPLSPAEYAYIYNEELLLDAPMVRAFRRDHDIYEELHDETIRDFCKIRQIAPPVLQMELDADDNMKRHDIDSGSRSIFGRVDMDNSGYEQIFWERKKLPEYGDDVVRSPIVSQQERQDIYDLYRTDPVKWNSVALANEFKRSRDRVEAILALMMYGEEQKAKGMHRTEIGPIMDDLTRGQFMYSSPGNKGYGERTNQAFVHEGVNENKFFEDDVRDPFDTKRITRNHSPTRRGSPIDLKPIPNYVGGSENKMKSGKLAVKDITKEGGRGDRKRTLSTAPYLTRDEHGVIRRSTTKEIGSRTFRNRRAVFQKRQNLPINRLSSFQINASGGTVDAAKSRIKLGISKMANSKEESSGIHGRTGPKDGSTNGLLWYHNRKNIRTPFRVPTRY